MVRTLSCAWHRRVRLLQEKKKKRAGVVVWSRMFEAITLKDRRGPRKWKRRKRFSEVSCLKKDKAPLWSRLCLLCVLRLTVPKLFVAEESVR